MTIYRKIMAKVISAPFNILDTGEKFFVRFNDKSLKNSNLSMAPYSDKECEDDMFYIPKEENIWIHILGFEIFLKEYVINPSDFLTPEINSIVCSSVNRYYILRNAINASSVELSFVPFPHTFPLSVGKEFLKLNKLESAVRYSTGACENPGMENFDKFVPLMIVPVESYIGINLPNKETVGKYIFNENPIGFYYSAVLNLFIREETVLDNEKVKWN